MGKIIQADFSKRAKDIRHMQKMREGSKKEEREQERINRAVNKKR